MAVMGSGKEEGWMRGASWAYGSSALSRSNAHCEHSRESWGLCVRSSKGSFLGKEPAYEQKQEPFIKSRGIQTAAVKTRASNTATNRKLHFPSLC